jgi:hypothetical protein
VDSNHRFPATVSFVKPQNHLLFAGTGVFTMEEAMTAMTKAGQVQKSYKPPTAI